MFTNRRKHEFLEPEFQTFWIGLAFQAGFVNTGGFLACARFVSHMTGFSTQVGISFSQHDYLMALEMLSAPASFVLGAVFSALAIDRPVVLGQKPHYLVVMFGILLLYSTITAAGVLGFFGPFGEELLYGRDFLLMSLLCFICGLQNACFSSLTRGQIRTTHLTGIMTDIGIAFVKIFYLPPKGREVVVLRRLNYVRMLTVLSFSLGATVSALMFGRLGYVAFAVLMVTSGALFIAMYFSARTREKRRREAVSRMLQRKIEDVEGQKLSIKPASQKTTTRAAKDSK